LLSFLARHSAFRVQELLAGMRGLLRENQRLGGVAGSLISRLLSSLLGQPQRRELAEGLLFPAQAVHSI
jgi:hypothetical protein